MVILHSLEFEMNKCSDIMTKDPLCCLPSDPVDKLAQLMGRRDIGPVLIIDNEQTRKLAGIVTDRDLALKVVAEGRDARTTKAEEIMTRKVMTVRDDDEVQKALDMMSELQLRRLPVINSNGMVVGILAQADVATRFNQPQQTADVVKDISQARSIS
jgi:CBS domain-containing protein